MSVAISGGVVAAAQMCMCVFVGRGFRFIISSFREQQLSWIGRWILFAQFGSAQSPWIGLGRRGTCMRSRDYCRRTSLVLYGVPYLLEGAHGSCV